MHIITIFFFHFQARALERPQNCHIKMFHMPWYVDVEDGDIYIEQNLFIFFKHFVVQTASFFFQKLIFIILKINSQSNSAFSEKKTYLRKSLKLGLPLLILLTFSVWLSAEGLISNTLIPCLVISAALEISTNLSKVSSGALNKR